MGLNLEYASYLMYRLAAYLLMNLGEDVAMAAFMFT